MRFIRVGHWMMCALAACAFTQCSTTHERKSADREAYKAVSGKGAAVPGMDPHFTIEQTAMPPLDGYPVLTDPPEYLGEAARSENDAHIISLEQALALGVQHNRSYQDEKESLYLAALSLTLDRHQYAPIFGGSVSGAYSHTTKDVQAYSDAAEVARQAPEIMQAVGGLAGAPADILNAYAQVVRSAGDVTGVNQPHTEIEDVRSVSGKSGFGVDRLLRGGGRIAVNLTTNFLRFLTGDPQVSATSALAGTITQPLLRGAGRKVAMEQLTQSERDLLYAVRDFARFRQEFTVRICSEYYGVLQSRDAVRNNWQSYRSFIKNAERQRAFAEEAKATQAEVRRLEQALLSNENSWVSSINKYKQQLDQFKLELGLSADVPVVLDDNEMKQLKASGILHPNVTTEDAVQVAVVSRLDLYTQRDKSGDMERKVAIAANALKPMLNVVGNVEIDSKPGNRPLDLDLKRIKSGAGFDVDFGLDRKKERNAYRAALIARERAKRDLALAEDKVKLGVRDAWRNLDQGKRSYEIAIKGVELNQRRVEEQNLLNELGRATALNQIDAQNDLTQAENNLTAALVSHTIARLQFWRDMGILFIKEDGRWEEVKDVEQP